MSLLCRYAPFHSAQEAAVPWVLVCLLNHFCGPVGESSLGQWSVPVLLLKPLPSWFVTPWAPVALTNDSNALNRAERGPTLSLYSICLPVKERTEPNHRLRCASK